MFYQSEITYAGRIPKAIWGDLFINTMIADDIPVTDHEVQYFIARFCFFSKPDIRAVDGDFQVALNGNEGVTFIGEAALLYNLLGEMMQNSIEAGSTIFKFGVTITDTEVVLTISDNGKGLPNDFVPLRFFEGHTTKATGWGHSLAYAALGIEKMGGSVAYLGKGIEDTGASFSITLLREMPEVQINERNWDVR